jgi:bacillithiol biosynthesis cysteine-adding enzyme BshC
VTLSAVEALAPLGLLEGPAGLESILARAAGGAEARAEVAAGLAVTNAAYGHPRAAELAERLAEDGVRVVITGQQAGLFGGPLLTLVKAAAAVRWAEALTAAGQPAVALFWMATEDHDYDEVARVAWPGDDGALAELELGADPSPLMPVGLRSLGAGITPVLEALARAGDDLPYQSTVARLAAWHRPSARFGEAFARLLVAVLGDRAPLVVDALLPELKRAERPILRAFVEQRHALDQATAAAEQRLVAAGRTLQVAPQPGVSPLFLLVGPHRRRIAWSGAEHWTVRGGDPEPREIAELLEIIEGNPAVISPGVLARPVVQDAVFGTSLQVLGAAELAYLEQVAPAYELLAVAPPAVVKRPSALVIDHRFDRWLDGLGLDLAQVMGDERALAEQLAAPHATRRQVVEARERIAALIDQLAPAATALDPHLARPLERTRRRALGALERLEQKVAAAIVRQDERVARQLAQMRGLLLPKGRMQERTLCVGWAWARWGDALGKALLERLDLTPGALTEVRL